MVLAAGPSFAGNSLPDLVAAAKASPDKFDIAHTEHDGPYRFRVAEGADRRPLSFVPYKGSATAMTDILGGQVPLTIDTVTALRGNVADGKLKALGITAQKSTELMPGVKSIAEQGLPGFEVTAWNAFYAPRDTPQAIIDLLNAELAKVLAQPETRKRLLELGFDPGGGTPADLAAVREAGTAQMGPDNQGDGPAGRVTAEGLVSHTCFAQL